MHPSIYLSTYLLLPELPKGLVGWLVGAVRAYIRRGVGSVCSLEGRSFVCAVPVQTDLSLSATKALVPDLDLDGPPDLTSCPKLQSWYSSAFRFTNATCLLCANGASKWALAISKGKRFWWQCVWICLNEKGGTLTVVTRKVWECVPTAIPPKIGHQLDASSHLQEKKCA